MKRIDNQYKLSVGKVNTPNYKYREIYREERYNYYNIDIVLFISLKNWNSPTMKSYIILERINDYKVIKS